MYFLSKQISMQKRYAVFVNFSSFFLSPFLEAGALEPKASDARTSEAQIEENKNAPEPWEASVSGTNMVGSGEDAEEKIEALVQGKGWSSRRSEVGGRWLRVLVLLEWLVADEKVISCRTLYCNRCAERYMIGDRDRHLLFSCPACHFVLRGCSC